MVPKGAQKVIYKLIPILKEEYKNYIDSCRN